jgi:hypothetical protein
MVPAAQFLSRAERMEVVATPPLLMWVELEARRA